jgi:hypothetical protein
MNLFYVEIARDNQWFNSVILSPKLGLMNDPWCLENHCFDDYNEAVTVAENEVKTWRDPEEVSFRVVKL